jgi:hypothetical protein
MAHASTGERDSNAGRRYPIQELLLDCFPEKKELAASERTDIVHTLDQNLSN